MIPAHSKSKDKGTSDGEKRDAAIHLCVRVSAIARVSALQVIAPSKREMKNGTSEIPREVVDSFGRYDNDARVHKHLKRRDSCKDENGAWLIPQVIYDNTNCRENNLLPPPLLRVYRLNLSIPIQILARGYEHAVHNTYLLKHGEPPPRTWVIFRLLC